MRALAGGLVLFAMGCTAHTLPGEGNRDDAARRVTRIRVVSWNIETVGAVGSDEHEAALDVLGRLDADVVALQEIASAADEADLWELADAAGYAEVAVGTAASGGDRSAVLSRRPLVDVAVLDAPALSGDPLANDLTRNALRVEVETRTAPLVLVTNHWKCCGGDDNEFRRAIESERMAQSVAPADPAADPVVVIGDFNEDPADLPLSPSVFYDKPDGLPQSYWIGDDLYSALMDEGIDNDPVAPLTRAGLTMLDAAQRDGSLDTFLTGGTLDVAFVSDAVRIRGVEIYDDEDEGLPSALTLDTPDLPAGTVATASDHHPLVLELSVCRRCRL